MNIYYEMYNKLADFAKLSEAVEQGRTPVDVTGLSQIHKAGIITALCEGLNKKALCIVADEAEGKRLCEDINAMSHEDLALLLCARDFTFRNVETVSHEFEHARLAVLGRILRGDYKVIVASVEGAMQYTLPPEELKAETVTLKTGEEYQIEDVISKLVAGGYICKEQVDGVCQFSRRGGILDIFPPDSAAPVRIEFWGDEIDTMAVFDLESQRRGEGVNEVEITPAGEVLCHNTERLIKDINEAVAKVRGKNAPLAKQRCAEDIERLECSAAEGGLDKYIPLIYKNPATLFDYCENDIVFVSELFKVRDTVKNIAWQQAEDIKQLFAEGVLFKGLEKFSIDYTDLVGVFEKRGAVYLDSFARSMAEIKLKELINMNLTALPMWGGELALLEEDLKSYVLAGFTCVVLAGTPRGAKALLSDLQRDGLPAISAQDMHSLDGRKIIVAEGSLSGGFELPEAKLAVITQGRALVMAKTRGRVKKSAKEVIRNLSDITKGDYVVHVSHGIGVYEGIHKLEVQGLIKDYIKIRYAGKDTLYVPVTQLDLVSKYIGPREDGAVRLNKLNSAEWSKTRTKVKKAVAEMAKELIELYSKRMKLKGHAFPSDTEWQKEFEERFEYDETEDQLRCVSEIKRDMQSETPMDRLLCGDVGFGKTEVALRGVFKCVTDSKQCAILVPTTILAWQHYQTVTKRFEGYPVTVELLSRFRTPKEQEKIIRRLRTGEIDIIIGTHRLVQKDIRFKDLGLVVIDEEQRFGVKHKEQLKELATNVDVLTLSATPIPRTLNMAMSGIRDMSVIEEAPRDRHPVQTYVLEHDDGVLGEAVRRELRRGGQVYYIHNQIDSIESCAARVLEHNPEARVATAHGRMSEEELSEVWRRLVDHEIDVLVCTTIIETGVDVANCNTLIVENADNMGLSQLYQLRGRVGRSSRRAFAYMTFRRGKIVTDIAAKRLNAIREFTKFGSGFSIAMRDLEIRGAGNILGAQQHGHMASVGYDMYVKLLSDAVAEQRGEAPDMTAAESLVDIRIEAHIPESYIEDQNRRIEIYRRIAGIRSENDVLDVTDELIDRFGEPPEPVRGLMEVALLRNKAATAGISEITQKADNLLFFTEKFSMELAGALVAQLKGRVMVNAGAKPYIAVKMLKGETPTQTIKTVLEAMNVDKK